jgi:peptidylprolyl isomerase
MTFAKKPVMVIAFAFASVLLLAGCTTDGGISAADPAATTDSSSNGATVTPSESATPTPAQTPVTSGATVMPTVSGEPGKAPTLTAPSGTPPTTLVTKDIFVGTGAAATTASTLTVQYTLMAWSTGQVVETSWTSQAATFPLSGVITGWQKGIPGMKVGGRRLLVIPPADGYGSTGAGSSIKPNETLIFVVDVLAIK